MLQSSIPQEPYNQGIKFYKEGRYKEAIKYLDEAVKQDPNNINAFLYKGFALDELGEKEKAIGCYNKVINIDPNSFNAYYNKALALSTLNKKEEAIECYNNAIKAQPSDANSYYNKGLTLYELGEKEKAIECYDKASNLDPNNYYIFYNKGAALYSLGRNIEAIECFDKVLSIKPSSFRTYYIKGNALFALGKGLEAIECFNRAIAINPNDANFYHNKGAALTNLGKYIEAIECFKQVIKLEPNAADAYHNKGAALYELGHRDKALECYDKAITISSNNPLYYCNKGKALNDLGKDSEALSCFNIAYELCKDSNTLSPKLTKSNITFVNEALAKDRETLLRKLVELQKVNIELGHSLGKLDKSNLEVRTTADNYGSMFDMFRQLTNKVMDSIDPIKSKNISEEHNIELLNMLAEFKSEQENLKIYIAKELTGVKEEIKAEIQSKTEVILKYSKLNLEATEKAASSLKKKILENTKASKHDKEAMNSLINGIEEKMKSLAKQEDVSIITEQMMKLSTQGEVTKKRLLAIEEDIDNLIERQDKTDERLEKLELFHQATDEIIQKIKGGVKASPKDRDRICDLIRDIEEKVQTLASKDDIAAITEAMIKLPTQGEVTKKRLATLEEDIDELIAKQEGNKAEVFAVTDIVYDNLLLNHPTLLKDTSNYLSSMSKAIDLSNQLSPSFMLDAIENNDPELILAGMLSLQGNYNQ